MNKKEFSPYIRVAMLSAISMPFKINNRSIFDYEIILVDGGVCDITIDNIKYRCKKNDVVFIRPGVEHKFESVENFGFVQPHIHFDLVYTEKSEERTVSFKPKHKMDDYELSLICEDVLEEVDIPYVFTPADMEKFKRIFFEIIEIFQNKAYNYELLCKAKMLELISCILAQFEGGAEINTAMAQNPVIAVKNYIDNNYLSLITLDSLSEQFHFNKYTLMRNFKSMYGQSVISYYRIKRIEYIKKALKTTTLPISALAEKLNFSDIYSFSRFFKLYVGISPLAYRKKSISSFLG